MYVWIYYNYVSYIHEEKIIHHKKTEPGKKD